NEKFGAKGLGTQNWIGRTAVIPYRINFENIGPGSRDGQGNPYPTFATAPAQRVTITDPLSTNLDWTTFELAELGFGDTIVPIPSGRKHYAGSVGMTFNDQTFNVEVEAGIDLANGRVFAVFQSIDPATSLPPDVLTGFLPPEDGTGRGKGHFAFLIKPRADQPSGTEIRNVAFIEFDRQMTIATDQVDPQNPAAGVDPNKQALNTLDSGPPESSVATLPAESGRHFIVEWSGQDDAGGSGLVSYDVYVSTNGGFFGRWLADTAATSMPFSGELGQTYAFYSRARDLVGNEEPAPLAPDAQTTVSTNAPVLLTLTNHVVGPGASFSLTNLLLHGLPTGQFMFTLLDGPAGAVVNPTNGVFRWTPSCEQGSSTNQVKIHVAHSAQPNLNDTTSFNLIVRECLQPHLGTLVLPVGTTGTLPIYLYSTEVLTNVVLTASLPDEKLTAIGLEAVAPEICASSIEQQHKGVYEIHLGVCAAPWLQPTQGQLIARLYLTAAGNQPSSLALVHLSQPVGLRPDGTVATDHPSQLGRVVILGNQPLLEALPFLNQQPGLMLYALTGSTNTLEFATNLNEPLLWHSNQQVIMTNLQRILEPPSAPANQRFYRARSP
ncbi:MAG TPA: hypothetical protein VNO52_13890, partial [Methylomirabilota bacterium]|nr:hypothetical protein [Methylomirabilota bacterium]